jgi:hypothetical protein
MPLLDVSSVLLDPDFADRFNVIRREEGVSDKGRRILTLTTLANKYGVVCAASPNDLRRLPDGQTFDRVISVVSKFPFFGACVGYQPDLIQWRGSSFIVASLDPYPQYGQGFSQVIAVSIDLQDMPIPLPGQQLDIDFVLDSSTLGAA